MYLKYVLMFAFILSTTITAITNYSVIAQAPMNMNAKPFDPFAKDNMTQSNINKLNMDNFTPNQTLQQQQKQALQTPDNGFSENQKAILDQLNQLAAGNNSNVSPVLVTVGPNDTQDNQQPQTQPIQPVNTTTPAPVVPLITPQVPVTINNKTTAPINNATIAKPSTSIIPANNNNTVEGLSKSIEGSATTTAPLTITGMNQYTKLGVFHILGDIVNKDTNNTAYTNLYLKITLKDKNGMIIGLKTAPLEIQRLVPNMPESFDVTLNDNDIGGDVFHIDGYSVHIYGERAK